LTDWLSAIQAFQARLKARKRPCVAFNERNQVPTITQGVKFIDGNEVIAKPDDVRT